MTETAALTQPPAPQSKAVVGPKPKPLQHRHPRDQRRHIVYNATCALCRQLDREREPISVEDIERTVFLVPEFQPERQICGAYLAKRYGDDANLIVRDRIDLKLLARLMKAQIVVCVRRSVTSRPVKSHTQMLKDTDGRTIEVARPYEDLIDEVIESEPLQVIDCVAGAVELGMFDEAVLDTDELVERLQELAYPFRAMRLNPPDTWLKITFS